MTSPYESPVDSRTGLIEACRDLVGEARLVVASNRGPVEYSVGPDGVLAPHRGRGGLVTAFTHISQFTKITWVASAMGDGDRRAAQMATGSRLTSPLRSSNMDVRFVVSPRSSYHKYYNVFSNPLLWFLQHQMWNAPYTPNIDASTYDAWENGYVTINRLFADAVSEELRKGDAGRVAIVHDYQLYLVGKMVREMVPDALLFHLVHTPWPSICFWRLLPAEMRRAICEGLCANDLVGFQTTCSANNFLHTVQMVIEEATVDYSRLTVTHGGHQTAVRVHPTSIDVPGLRRTANSARVREHYDRLEQSCQGVQVIVRVDRIDPSRNILRGFRAYDRLLDQHPELVGKVKFLAFLSPSRTRVREYQRYTEELSGLVQTINERYGGDGWRPLDLYTENNYLQAVAGLLLYDVLLVNPIVDGMNLAAKEGPVINLRDGALLLSDGTGAYEELRDASLVVAPTDLEATAQAFYQALTMNPEERRRRAGELRSRIEREDMIAWLRRQFSDLREVSRAPRQQASPAGSRPGLPLPQSDQCSL
ncbi:MAG: alpha,alpha-trehalose-phosphate synthase (UDP-forming) [Chloroflexota bacterium]